MSGAAQLGHVDLPPAFGEADLAELAEQVRASDAALRHAVNFFSGPFFAAQIAEAIERAVAMNGSPWLNRSQAAAYAGGASVSTIDRAVKLKILVPRYRESKKLFLKSEIDEAIVSGRWRKAEGV